MVVLFAVAVWLVANYAPSRSVPGLFAVADFGGFGVAQYVLGRWYGHPVFWAGLFSVFEVALLIGVVLAPITFPEDWRPQMQLRLPTVSPRTGSERRRRPWSDSLPLPRLPRPQPPRAHSRARAVLPDPTERTWTLPPGWRPMWSDGVEGVTPRADEAQRAAVTGPREVAPS